MSVYIHSCNANKYSLWQWLAYKHGSYWYPGSRSWRHCRSSISISHFAMYLCPSTCHCTSTRWRSGKWSVTGNKRIWPCLAGVYCSMLPIEKILHNYATLSHITLQYHNNQCMYLPNSIITYFATVYNFWLNTMYLFVLECTWYFSSTLGRSTSTCTSTSNILNSNYKCKYKYSKTSI